MRKVKRVIILLLLLVGMIAVFGCAEVKDDDISRPWAQPEPWERNMGMGLFTPE